jgi:hypothetical protein
MKPILLALLATASIAQANILITEVNSNSAGADFFELYNHGASAIDLTGWKWTDNEANFNGTKQVTFGSVTIPAGGVLVVMQGNGTTNTVASFRTAWNNLSAGVAVVDILGPGLASDDAVVLFNAAGNVAASFNYGTSAISATLGNSTTVSINPATQSNGTPARGGHAGPSVSPTGSGIGNAISAVWTVASGTASPRHTFATAGSLGAYAQTGSSTSVGSPGVLGTASGLNTPPLFTGASETYWRVERNFNLSTFRVTATDVDPGQSVTLSVVSKPAWLSFNTGNGQFSGLAPASGDYTVIIRATDNAAPTASTDRTYTLKVFGNNSPVLLNEYNAVSSSNFLGGGTVDSPTFTDSFFGRVTGNGGEWFELVVVGNGSAGSTVDMRGWKIDVVSDTGTRTLALSQHPYWQNVVSGTLLTFTVNSAANGGADTEIHKASRLHDPGGNPNQVGNLRGYVWSNIWIQDSLFVDKAASTFSDSLGINQSATQFVLRNSAGVAFYGPAGEGIASVLDAGIPTTLIGVSSSEALQLEVNPAPSVDPLFGAYKDITSSSFGNPNLWSEGAASQQFGSFVLANSPPQFTTQPIQNARGSYSYVIGRSDPNSHSVALSATGLPSFLSLSGNTLATNRALTITDAGVYPITIVANDGQGSANLSYQSFNLTVFHSAPKVILNEYNAVSGSNLIGGSLATAVDTHFGRIAGNGGDWVEFVVVGNDTAGTVDMRGWSIEVGHGRFGGFKRTSTLLLSQHADWAAVPTGTILTFSEKNTAEGGLNTGFPIRNRRATLGDTWINVCMGDTVYLTFTNEATNGYTILNGSASGVDIDDETTQFQVRDSLGRVEFGPAGEGIAPLSGISATEIFELEGHPRSTVSPLVTSNDLAMPPTLGYDDGASGSTFGFPNDWTLTPSGTAVQDFTPFILVPDGFTTWISAFSPPPANTTKGGDSDGDGRINYLEYVFGGDPRFADAEPAQTVAKSPTLLTWSFAIRNDNAIPYSLTRSVNLTQWFNFVSPTVQVVPHPTLAGFNLVTLTATPNAVDGKEFVRVAVVVP